MGTTVGNAARYPLGVFRLAGRRLTVPGGDAVDAGPAVARRLDRVWAAAPWTIGAVALGAWWVALPGIDVRAMDDTGLGSQLDATFFLAVLLINAAFAVAVVRDKPSSLALGALTVVLILMLYGVTSIIEELPRGAVTWLHAGFADVIERTGTLPKTDARFDWPGFFVLVGFVTAAAGLDHPIQLAAWATPVLNLLYMPFLFLIYRAVTDDHRLAWTAVWVFFLGNWVGQDYFSPQGFTFLLYLVIVAIVLRWFGPRSGIARRPRVVMGLMRRSFPAIESAWGADRRWIPGASGGLVLVVATITAAIASSHQLTPLVLVASLAGLVVLGLCRLSSLPLLTALIVGVWLSYMTVDFLSGHLGKLISDVGQAEAIATANVTSRVTGSAGHVAIVQFRLAFTAVIWLLAAAGVIARRRNGAADVAILALAVIPFGLVALQSYGGEILLRVFFFSLPFASFLVAGLVFTKPAPATLRTFVLLTVGGFLIGAGFLFARYGNERLDYVSPQDLAAVDRAYEILDEGGLIVRANYNDPVGYRGYEQYRYFSAQNAVLNGNINLISRYLRTRSPGDAVLLMTRGQQARLELFASYPASEWDRLLERLRSSRLFVELYSNSDAVIFGTPPRSQLPLR